MHCFGQTDSMGSQSDNNDLVELPGTMDRVRCLVSQVSDASRVVHISHHSNGLSCGVVVSAGAVFGAVQASIDASVCIYDKICFKEGT